MWIGRKDVLMHFLQFLLNSIKYLGSLASKVAAFTVRLASKVAAYYVYLEVCFVYYGTRGVGLVIYVIAFATAFFTPEMNPLRIMCWLYVSHLIGTIAVLKIVFQSERFEKWVYREVGYQRVHSKLYSTVLLAKVIGRVAASSAVTGGAELVTYGANLGGVSVKHSLDVDTINRGADGEHKLVESNRVRNNEHAERSYQGRERATIITENNKAADKQHYLIDEKKGEALGNANKILEEPTYGMFGHMFVHTKQAILHEYDTEVKTTAIKEVGSTARSWGDWFSGKK